MSKRLALLLGAVSFVLAGGVAEPAEEKDPEIPFEKYELDNGLEVILVPDQTVPLVAVSVWYHVGSGHETVGKSGFAHLFEHMLFQGSKNVGADKHFDVLKKMGSVNVNGTTNPDRTNYFEVVPSNQLEAVLWLESDRMGFLLPELTQASLDNQIDVVRNERRQRYDNVPYGKARFALAEMLYPEGHPYRYLTIGRHEDLESASLDDVLGFYKTWYVPANATLTIAGDFDVAEAKALVQEWFGSFPESQKPTVNRVPAPVISSQKREIADDFAKLRQYQWAWHSPAMFETGDAELDLVAHILGQGEASRLYKLLVVEKQLAQSVNAYQASTGFSSTFVVNVTLRSDADVATVEELVEAELGKLRDEPVSDRELARAVTRYEASAVYRLEDLLARAETLQSYNHYLGKPGSIGWDLDRYRAVTTRSLQAEAQRWLRSDRQVELLTVPAAGGAR
jgi:predicted Zn-dependent peptidase